MFLIDTNILVHAARRESVEYEQTATFLRKLPLQSNSWALSWNILYEFLRVSTHPRVFTHPLTLEQAWVFVSVLLGSPNCLLLSETELHADVMTQSMNEVIQLSGNRVHDFHTAVLMREHGIDEIVTFDKDFRAFPWVTVREP